MNMTDRWRKTAVALHRDEHGLKVLEVVAILAVAAIALTVIRFFWFRVVNWFVVEAADTSEGWAGAKK